MEIMRRAKVSLHWQMSNSKQGCVEEELCFHKLLLILFCAKCSHTNALWWHLVYDCMIVWLSRTSIATQERLHDPAGKPTVYHSRAQSERQIFRAARKGGGGGRDKLETYPVRTARPCLPCTESPCEACVSCTWS